MNSRVVFIVGLLILLSAGGGVAWYFFSSPTPITQTNSLATSTAAVVPPSEPPTPPSGTKEYHSTRFHFSLFYPENLSSKEYNETDGGFTVSLQNPETGQGLQIYAVPYDQPKVTPERFKEDEPSGVLKNPTSVTIDGAEGSAFYSTSVALGDTYELWFIHNGYLYEVTTLKPLATWLNQIMQTWKFTS